jgi:hypothetical protein
MWKVGPKAGRSWANFQGQDSLTKPFWNVQFYKQRGRQVVGFNAKLTRRQPITNIVSR